MLNNSHLSIPKLVFFVLALALQIHFNLFAHAGYKGLLFNIADLLLPFLGIYVAFSLLTQKSEWPIWQKPFGYWAPALMSLCIVFGVLNGYRLLGVWEPWSVFNKGIGWFVLMSYLMLGAWFAANYSSLIRQYFIQPFIIFLCVTCIIEMGLRLIVTHEIFPESVFFAEGRYPQVMGFMVNRNALAMLYCSSLALGSVFLTSNVELTRIENYGFRLLWAILPLFFVMNGSRTILLIAVPLILFMLFKNWRLFLKQIAPLMLPSFMFMPLLNIAQLNVLLEKYLGLLPKIAANESARAAELSVSDSYRIKFITDGLQLYRQNPITGAGIGANKLYHLAEGEREQTVLDNSLIWVLTEMGPAALIAFFSSYLAMFLSLKNKIKQTMITWHSTFYLSVIFMMMVFGIFSLFHEVLYSRFLWVFLGLGLGLPISQQVISKHKANPENVENNNLTPTPPQAV